MPVSARVRQSAAGRLALLLAAAAQLAVAFIAPAAEARTDRDTRAHIEVAGTRLHHAHVETMCPACSAQHLMSVPPSGGASTPAAALHAQPLAATASAVVTHGRFGPSAPRAPPRSL